MSRNDELDHYMVLRKIDGSHHLYNRIGWLSAIIQHEGNGHEGPAMNEAKLKVVTIV